MGHTCLVVFFFEIVHRPWGIFYVGSTLVDFKDLFCKKHLILDF
jgi:hypothetical protein